MKTTMMKAVYWVAALALGCSVSPPAMAQHPPKAALRVWTLEAVGTETATPDVYYLLMKMEYQSGLASEAATQGERSLGDFLAAVDALHIPNLSYRVCNNLITPANELEAEGFVYTRNVVFKLMSSHAGEPLPTRDAIIAKLEDLGARHNSHCVTCIGSG